MSFLNELMQKYPQYAHCFNWNNLDVGFTGMSIDTIVLYHKLGLPESVSHKIYDEPSEWAWNCLSEIIPWEDIKAHPELPWVWSGECEIGGVSNNPSVPWEDIYESIANKNSEVHCYSTKWDWMWLTVHKNVTWEIIQQTKDITDPETGEKLFKWDTQQVIYNVNIPMSVFMSEPPEIKREHYEDLVDAEGRKVTMEEFEWHYNKMKEWGLPHTYGALNPFKNVNDVTLDFIKRYPDLVKKRHMMWITKSKKIVSLNEILNTDGITFVDNTFLKWNYSYILTRKDVTPEFVRQNIMNPKFGWIKNPPPVAHKCVTLDLILENINLPWKIDHLYTCLEYNPSVTWNELQKIDPYSFSCIRKTFTKEYYEQHNFKWKWSLNEYIAKNPNVTWQWILNNEKRLGITPKEKRAFSLNYNITWDVVDKNPEIFEDEDAMHNLTYTQLFKYA